MNSYWVLGRSELTGAVSAVLYCWNSCANNTSTADEQRRVETGEQAAWQASQRKGPHSKNNARNDKIRR